MTKTDGVMRKRWEVHCYNCEQGLLGLVGRSAKEAGTEARREGWKLRTVAEGTRRWHCPECLQGPS